MLSVFTERADWLLWNNPLLVTMGPFLGGEGSEGSWRKGEVYIPVCGL